MDPHDNLLPLFPLNTVLFPYAYLPLQVFEERYLRLLEDCRKGAGEFGVVLIRSGTEVGSPAVPYDVGTVARIVQVNPTGRGMTFVSVVGARRFRILSLSLDAPYLSARVELLSEEDAAKPSTDFLAQVRGAVTEHVRLTLGLRGGWIRDVPMPREAAPLSYYVARLLPLSLREKQELLEVPTAQARLARELELVAGVRASLRRQVAERLGVGRFGVQ